MRFNRELYPKIALLKSAYSFTNRAYVHLDCDDGFYYVDLTPKPGCPIITEEEFSNEMLSQSVRHEIYTQTKTLRELLVARAMASTVIYDTSEDTYEPTTEVQNDAAKQILTDWFEAHDQA